MNVINKTPQDTIAALERLLSNGYGRTGKPLSAKRIARIRKEIEKQKNRAMTNEDKLLEIAEAEYTDLPGATRYNEIMATNRTNLIARLTALISEHYYPKEKYDELLQQRDELRELLKRFTECMRRYWADTYQEEAPDLSLVTEAEAAIKNTER